MEIRPVAYFRSPVGGKFGLPRQSGLASSLSGQIVLEPAFRSPDALRGIEGFDYLWLIWGFSLNRRVWEVTPAWGYSPPAPLSARILLG